MTMRVNNAFKWGRIDKNSNLRCVFKTRADARYYKAGDFKLVKLPDVIAVTPKRS